MSAILDGVGKILGKISDHVQGRIERLKNEKERLLDERKKLFSCGQNDRASNRLVAIDLRLHEINTILGNKATD